MNEEAEAIRGRGDVVPFPGAAPPGPPRNGRELLGEVIGASFSQFLVESYDVHSTPPPLGALVVVQDVLGLVCDARTEGLGPISAKGTPQDADGDVYRIHPELSRTLRSQFTALVVGHYAWTPDRDTPPTERRIVYTYPEAPPRLHYKAYRCASAELIRFTEKPNYLRLLMQSQEMPVDEVVIHLLAQSYEARDGDRAHLLATTEYLGRLLKGQYDRLVAILETVGSLIGEDEG